MLFEWWAWCIDAGVNLLEVGRPVIEQWAKKLKTDGLAASTIAGKIKEVQLFYRWCYEEGHTGRDLAAWVRLPRRPRRSSQRWLTRDQATEVLRLACEAGTPWDLAIHLMLLNGLRRTETLEARCEHIEHIDGRTTLLLPSRKGGVLDRLTLPARTVALLPARERGLLLLEQGKKITPSRLYKVLGMISANAGIDFALRPHMLRATFVTLSLDAGVPARDVMASAGHASVEMTAYYDRAHAAIRRNAAPRLAEYLSE
ncbi:tyrosine-type recombinase/integrase [Arcanobacterium canis]